MDSLYNLAVRLELSAGGVASGAAMAMAAFGKIEQAAGLAEAAVVRHQAALDRMNFTGVSHGSAQYQWALQQQGQAATAAALANDKLATAQRGANLAMAGAMLTGAGFLGLGVIKGWVKDAETMQDALAKVSLATTGTSAQLAALQSQSYTVAGQTQYSAPQIMDMEAKMGRMGINRRDWVQQDIPTIARSAEIDQRMAGISPESSIPAMISQAHMLGATHGKAFIDNIALGTRALLASGMTPEEQNTTLKYLLPAKNATGMTNAEMFQWASLSNLMGLSQGKGGSYLGAMFSELVPGVGTKKHLQALARLDQLGGGHIYEHGNMVDSARVQQIISRALAAEPTDAAKQALAFYAFGKQGERAAFAMTSPVAMANSEMLRHKLAPYDPVKNPTGIASVEEMQQKLNQTMVGQLNTLNTNMHSMGAMLGGELIPDLTKAASALVQLTGGMIAFGQQHPVLVRIAAGAAVVATAIGLILGPILIVAGAAMILDTAFLPVIGVVLAVTAAIAGVILVATHWGEVTDWVGKHLAFLAVAAAPLLVLGSGIITVVGGVVWLFTHWGDVTKAVGTALGGLGHAAGAAFSGLGTMAHAAMGKVGDFFSLLGSVGQLVLSGVGVALSPITDMLGVLGEAFAPAAHAATQALGSFFSGVGTLAHGGRQAMGDFFSLLGSQTHDALGALGKLWTSIGGMFGTAFDAAFKAAGNFFSGLGSLVNGAIMQLEKLLNLLNPARTLPTGPPTMGLHPQAPIVHNVPDPRIRGSTVTTLPPTFDPSQVLGSSTVGTPSGSLGFKPFVAPHPTRAAGPAGSGRPVVNMHPGAVPVTINLHVGDNADHAATGKKLARHVAAVFHSEIDAAIRNAQGQSLDMNGHYA